MVTSLEVLVLELWPIRRFLGRNLRPSAGFWASKAYPFWPHVPSLIRCGSAPRRVLNRGHELQSIKHQWMDSVNWFSTVVLALKHQFACKLILINENSDWFAINITMVIWGRKAHLRPYLAIIDEYSMMSHRQGNAKLEYNSVFRAQLCMITGSRSVK